MLTFLKSLLAGQRPEPEPAPEWTNELWDETDYARTLAAETGAAHHAAHDEPMFADDQWHTHANTKPAVNVDGTPMVGDVDINGNLYGITSSTSGMDHNWHSSADFGMSDSSWSSSSSFSDSWSSSSSSDSWSSSDSGSF